MRSLILFCFSIVLLATEVHGAWTSLAPGMDIGSFTANKASLIGDSQITILRMDPKLWELVLLGSSWNEKYTNQAARDWAESNGLVAATNAGMFGSDYKTHIGYLATEKHINNSHINSYMSVAAFNPKKGKSLPEFILFDLDDPAAEMKSIIQNYNSVVQNLRLIKKPGENRWNQQDRMWSESALGEDELGRILFIFSRSPFTMHDLNNELLSMNIGVVAAQHLEGGPEAQLFVNIGGTTINKFGGFETSFSENKSNMTPWPIPNILGVRPKKH